MRHVALEVPLGLLAFGRCREGDDPRDAGIDVMGYCTNIEYHRFLHQAPIFERMLVEDGVLLLKSW
jgi:hypothetical protein